MSKMIIEALKVPALIGVYASEKKAKQILSIDISFSIDLERAAKKDLITDTIDYTEIRLAVLDFALSTHFNLLESFSKKLFDYLKNDFNLKNLTLSVTKFPSGMKDAAGVKITINSVT